ncbi:MAG TPA: hypothetical protein VFM05_01090, partial [Candidatus Saccharimonadales bacterium]|nr:hypothetical protein [Candidatus Saccharimonadales bacterium]
QCLDSLFFFKASKYRKNKDFDQRLYMHHTWSQSCSININKQDFTPMSPRRQKAQILWAKAAFSSHR